jgi:hypothetical protein
MPNPENNFESVPNPEKNSPQHTQEIIDSLRLETQAVSPEQREKFSALVRECHAAFISLYGQYIEHPLTDQEMADRFILTDQETFKEFYNGYSKNINTYGYTGDDSFMSCFRIKGIKFVIGYANNYWQRITKEGKNILIEMEGSENQAESKVIKMAQTNNIAHETAHMYGASNIPFWFQEYGALFYGKEIENLIESLTLSVSTDNNGIDYYTALVKKHGVIIHRLYFSENLTPEDKKLVYQLDEEFELQNGQNQ